MNIKIKRRNFLKKFLFSLLVIPIFKFNFFSSNTTNFKLIKKNNLIWYLNNND
tara:strand:+ start:1083 stop:1241 length:159 start_codon:yes stop_codon:yes gene_type:complete